MRNAHEPIIIGYVIVEFIRSRQDGGHRSECVDNFKRSCLIERSLWAGLRITKFPKRSLTRFSVGTHDRQADKEGTAHRTYPELDDRASLSTNRARSQDVGVEARLQQLYLLVPV